MSVAALAIAGEPTSTERRARLSAAPATRIKASRSAAAARAFLAESSPACACLAPTQRATVAQSQSTAAPAAETMTGVRIGKRAATNGARSMLEAAAGGVGLGGP